MDAEVAGMQRERPDVIDDESDELDPRVEVSSCCKERLSCSSFFTLEICSNFILSLIIQIRDIKIVT